MAWTREQMAQRAAQELQDAFTLDASASLNEAAASLAASDAVDALARFASTSLAAAAFFCSVETHARHCGSSASSSPWISAHDVVRSPKAAPTPWACFLTTLSKRSMVFWASS